MQNILRIVLIVFLLSACYPSAPTLAPVSTPSEVPPTSTTEAIASELPTSIPTQAATLSPAREDTSAILERLGGEPCPESDFTCIKLSVPRDHFDADNDEAIEVVFGVLPASGERNGMFVTATGGPGYSGLSAADYYTSYFDPSIPEHFDIVFFDQRGLGRSGGLQCVNAAVAFYRADWFTYTPEQEAAFVETARAFAGDCVKEMGLPVEELPFYSTRQAVEDLEIFRQAMGDEKLWLYGESYGTQYAQTYAAAHPDRLAGLILDGTVDLTLSGPEYYVGATEGFYHTLIETLDACTADEACAADLGGDARAFYDDLSAEVFASPQTVSFPLPSGEIEERSINFADFDYVVSSELYSEGSRLMLMRALAAAYRGDLVPLTRLLYVDLYLDPLTLEPIPDPDYSDGIYYTVTCNDYSYFSGSPEERAEAMMRAGDALEAAQPYMSSIFYGDIPCIFWPVQGEVVRPAPLKAPEVPTLVLGATADPITPVQYGTNVFRYLEDGYQITTEGGAHVIFGRGNECPDELVTAFLVDGLTPEERETTCEGVIFNPYQPVSPIEAADFADPLEAMISADNEIYYLPEYYYWDVETPTSVGCPYGGVLQFEATEVGDSLTLDSCAFSRGFILTGAGGNDYEAGLFTLEVTVGGLGSGALSYVRDDNLGAYTLTGDYNGEEVELSQ
jgi:pimeloyl-ACP methyl ester carboxylesterase